MSPRRWTRVADVACVALLAFAAFLVFSSASRSVRFQGDESNYMYRGRYFSYFFLRHNFSPDLWGNGHHVHTQPMLANYIVGGTLWLAGRNPESFLPYDWGKTGAQNADEGRIPDEATLALVRTPMVGLAVGVVLLLYANGRLLGGPAAGLAAGLVGLTSPLTQVALPRARNDCSLAFFLLLALLVGLLGARRGRAGALPAGWAVATGLALGLAMEAKLTGLLGLAAALTWGGLAALLAGLRADPAPRARLRAAWVAGRGWLLATLIGVGLFYALYPHLWQNPIVHTPHLFENRLQQMLSHQRNYPSSAVPNIRDRPPRVIYGSLVRTTWAGSRRVPLEGLAAIVGCGALLASAWRRWRQGQIPAVEGLLLTTVLVYFAGVSAGLYVAFELYFLPTLLLTAVLSGVGVGAIACRLLTGPARTLCARLCGPVGGRGLRPLTG
jgi:4-amino-4-deoxy-L-arabinose transferase-like glycosyltransferase